MNDAMTLTRKTLEAARVLKEQIAELANGDADFIRDTLEGELDFDIVRALARRQHWRRRGDDCRA